MSSKETTEPKVFIIESLDIEDEANYRFEGNIISSILKLSNIESKYYYLRTKKEFIEIVKLFNMSNYRYLHISCHGGKMRNSIWTTFDEIQFSELADILDTKLYHKRLFLSACSVVNRNLADQIISKTNCYSIIGPKHNIEFRDAAILWSSFYHLMFKMNSKRMVREVLIKNIQKVVNTFNEPLNYYSAGPANKSKYVLIKPIL